MDDPNELTMAELILMRNSYSNDLDKAQRLARSKACLGLDIWFHMKQDNNTTVLTLNYLLMQKISKKLRLHMDKLLNTPFVKG